MAELSVTVPASAWFTSNRFPTNRGHHARMKAELRILATAAHRAAGRPRLEGPVHVCWWNRVPAEGHGRGPGQRATGDETVARPVGPGRADRGRQPPARGGGGVPLGAEGRTAGYAHGPGDNHRPGCPVRGGGVVTCEWGGCPGPVTTTVVDRWGAVHRFCDVHAGGGW